VSLSVSARFSTARSPPYHAVGVRLVCFLAIRHQRDRAPRRSWGTMGVRKSVYVLTAVEVEALGEAFLAVMGLRDERGYQYHAGLHGLPLPIQCRHGDLLFLPWHRAYLYLFELALQDRMPEVAVPWWDWISASAHQEGLPPTHAAQAREDGRPNPLFDSEVLLPPAELELVRERLPGALTDDDPPRTRRDPDLPDELPRDRTIRSILRAPTFSDFSLRLENVHNDVHVWVGGSMSSGPGGRLRPSFGPTTPWSTGCGTCGSWPIPEPCPPPRRSTSRWPHSR
jgi:tyrosinase